MFFHFYFVLSSSRDAQACRRRRRSAGSPARHVQDRDNSGGARDRLNHGGFRAGRGCGPSVVSDEGERVAEFFVRLFFLSFGPFLARFWPSAIFDV